MTDSVRARFRNRPPAVAESAVMGKSAVAVIVAAIQLPALAQLFGLFEASGVIATVGGADVAILWSTASVLAGLAMIGSYIVHDPVDDRVLEIAADLLVALASGFFLYAVLTISGISGAAWAASISAALTINCLGRAVLLAHQIWWVKRNGGVR